MKNKDLTKRKLINAVGEILQTEGFNHLGVNNIARKAECSKKLIYRYFGGVDQLIEAYVVERDYWMTFFDQMDNTTAEFESKRAKPLVTNILKDQFNFFNKTLYANTGNYRWSLMFVVFGCRCFQPASSVYRQVSYCPFRPIRHQRLLLYE
jgi:AcrR family transcriptional regulator